MTADGFPATAAWTHTDARQGFEVVFFRSLDAGWRIDGCTTAVEAGQTWAVRYGITLNRDWTTHRAEVASSSASGDRSTLLEADGAGRWMLDGEPADQLDGCLDVDLESSAVTNALPIRRLGLRIGATASGPAAYVRAVDGSVDRLEQTYTRTGDEGTNQQYEYAAPVFDVSCRLRYDEFGLVLAYPGLAVRTL